MGLYQTIQRLSSYDFKTFVLKLSNTLTAGGSQKVAILKWCHTSCVGTQGPHSEHDYAAMFCSIDSSRKPKQLLPLGQRVMVVAE